MYDQNSSIIMSPILNVMKYMGFRQNSQKNRIKYYLIQIIRLISLLVVLHSIIRGILNFKSINNSRGWVKYFSMILKVIMPLVIMYSNNWSDILDDKIDMSSKSVHKLKLISITLICLQLASTVLVIILDLMKYFLFENYYILTSLNIIKIDRSYHAQSFNFIIGSISYFLMIRLPVELSCLFCAINCMVISRLFKELNESIAQNKFKFSAIDLRRIYFLHNRISEQVFRLSNAMSIPLILIYYHFITHICEFTFHIISFILDPVHTGR